MTNSSNELPSGRNHRYMFVSVVAATCAALYFLDLWLTTALEGIDSASIKQHISIFKSVIENLIAGAIAAVLLALTYRSVVAWIDPGDRVIEVPPTAITDRLIRNARSTRSYVFIGNTASFVSSSVLPALAESARTSGHPKLVTLFLIDPTDITAVAAYVGYRELVAQGSYRVADSEQATWFLPQQKRVETPDEVVAKVVASIYIAAYVALYPGMNVAIYLRRSFTPFRADISDQEAVLTQESAAESAVAFSSRGHFYGWYQKEADAQKGQGIAFDFSASRDGLRALKLAHPTDAAQEVESSLSALLSHFAHLAPLASNSSVVSKATKLISRPSRKYR
jgi:hypothetical protein